MAATGETPPLPPSHSCRRSSTVRFRPSQPQPQAFSPLDFIPFPQQRVRSSSSPISVHSSRWFSQPPPFADLKSQLTGVLSSRFIVLLHCRVLAAFLRPWQRHFLHKTTVSELFKEEDELEWR